VKSATIYDVARSAGVSHQTVTRYLKGFEGIRPATRERVEQAIAELDYKPNAAARQLRLNRVNRIAILAHRIEQTGPARILRGMTRAAQERGYVAEIISMDGVDQASVDTAIDLATEHQVAGVLASAQTEIVLERLTARSLSVPLIIDAHVVENESGLLVNEVAGRVAAEHLLDLGHRRVGYLAGPDAWFAARERRKGFADAIAERGATVAWAGEGDWSAASGFAAWNRHSIIDQGVTAVAVGNDSMAIGFIAAAATDGIHVPDDLSVIGTDDLPEARFLLPSSLSTVVVDFEGEGERLASELVALIDGRGAQPNVASSHPPRVEARASTRRV
jgi:DNA-binding LacI/PurR family transcriptional regulator